MRKPLSGNFTSVHAVAFTAVALATVAFLPALSVMVTYSGWALLCTGDWPFSLKTLGDDLGLPRSW